MHIFVTKMDSMAIESCENDSNCVIVRDPSFRNCPMGLGKSLNSNIINRGSQIIQNCHHLLATYKAEARRTRSGANNLETKSDSWKRQVEAGASGVPQELGKLKGHARRRAQPARRAGKKDRSG